MNWGSCASFPGVRGARVPNFTTVPYLLPLLHVIQDKMRVPIHSILVTLDYILVHAQRHMGRSSL